MLTFSDLRVHGLVNGVKVTSKDLLTRTEAQVMKGRLTIKADGGKRPAQYNVRFSKE